MPPRSGQPPGWYRDPDNPSCLRHWSGYDWSERRRALPRWDVAGSDWIAPPLPGDTGGPVLEGPVRTPGLPAIAAATAGRPRTRPLGNSRQRIQRAAPRSTGPARGNWQKPPVVRPPVWSSRRPAVVVSAVVLVALLALVASVTITRPVHYVQWSLDDPQFLTDSNNLCARSLPAARPSSAPAMTAATPRVSAPSLVRWADTIAATGTRIRSLPSLPDDVEQVNGWLDNWQAYSAAEMSYANWLATNPRLNSPAAVKTAAKLGAAATSAAAQADSFAQSNGLGACVLVPAAGVSPS